MHTAIEISLYPLAADYIPSIKAFIERFAPCAYDFHYYKESLPYPFIRKDPL